MNPLLRFGSLAASAFACAMLFGALGKHPYGYYQILRWVTCGACALLIWRGVVQRQWWPCLLAAVAILFNPVAPIHLTRETWRILDLAGAGAIALAAVVLEAILPRPMNREQRVLFLLAVAVLLAMIVYPPLTLTFPDSGEGIGAVTVHRYGWAWDDGTINVPVFVLQILSLVIVAGLLIYETDNERRHQR